MCHKNIFKHRTIHEYKLNKLQIIMCVYFKIHFPSQFKQTNHMFTYTLTEKQQERKKKY